MEKFKPLVTYSDHGLYFFETYNNKDSNLMCIIVKFMVINTNNYISALDKRGWLIHPEKKGQVTVEDITYKFLNEIEISGVVIGGIKLQQLIQELHARQPLLVNCYGLCLTYTSDSLGRNRTYYPLFELFDWSKYGFAKLDHLADSYWSDYKSNIWGTKGFPPSESYHKFGNYNDSIPWKGDESQVIRLNGNDMFISCKDGPILLWKVDRPDGDIRNVRLMGEIDGIEDKARIEVNGVTLKGGKLLALRDELSGRQVMVNAQGWCLYYTRGQRDVYYYYKITYHLEWDKYGVPTSANSLLWNCKSYFSEVEPITEVVIPITTSGNKNNNESGCEAKLKETERELDDYKLQVKEKDKKLDLLQQSLKEKQQELEDCEEKLKKVTDKEVGVLEKRLKEKDEELLKCKSQLKEKEREINGNNKLLKEKNQELSDCKLELEDKKKELCRVEEIENELKECESQKKNIEEELRLCKSQLEEKERELKVTGQELLKCKSHSEKKKINCKKALIKAPEEEEEEACM